MACEYFEDGALCRCHAVRGLLVPSHHERELFCLGDPGRCPTRRLRDHQGRALDEDVYYAIWLPENEGEAAGERTLPGDVQPAHAGT